MDRIFNIIPGKDAACILLYGNIGSGGRVSSADVVSELLALQSQYRKIDVRINSYGGEVYEGIAICNALRGSDAEIDIYIDGIAASIASVIALCGKPLHMSRFSRLMLHQVSGGAYGTADDIRRVAEAAESAQDTLAQIVAGKCGMTAEEVSERYFSGGEHWIGAEEALDMGLIDSIYDIDGEAPEAAATPDDIYKFTNRLNTRPQRQAEMAFLDEVRKHPSFANAATEADVLAHIAALENEAAKIPALQGRVVALENERKASLRAAHEALVNQAVSEGRITADQKAAFMNLLESDETNTKALLDSFPKRQARIVDFIGGGASGSGKDLESMSWDEIDRAERLMELKNNHPALYEAKYKEKFNR